MCFLVTCADLLTPMCVVFFKLGFLNLNHANSNSQPTFLLKFNFVDWLVQNYLVRVSQEDVKTSIISSSLTSHIICTIIQTWSQVVTCNACHMSLKILINLDWKLVHRRSYKLLVHLFNIMIQIKNFI